MGPISLTLLTAITEGVVGHLLENIGEQQWADKIRAVLTGEPFKSSFGLALARALAVFARSYPELTNAFFDESFLTRSDVHEELGKLVTFAESPDISTLISIWEGQFGSERKYGVELAEPFNFFLEIFSNELKVFPEFRGTFDSKSLASLSDAAIRTEKMAIDTAALQAESNSTLQAIRDLLSDPVHTVIKDSQGVVIGNNNTVYMRFLTEQYAPFASHLINYSTLIEDRVTDFTGRHFVMEALDRFLLEADRGYFIVSGEPGIGKTAFSAQAVRTRGYAHHFVVGSLGIVNSSQFINSVCAQLIAKFGLAEAYIPADAGSSSIFLVQLLEQISARMLPEEKCVIVVDGLDEASKPQNRLNNVLFLPSILPAHTYFLATHRPMDSSELQLRLDIPFAKYELEGTSHENMLDIANYLTSVFEHGRIHGDAFATEIDRDTFVEMLASKSEGNFMYLRHVLTELKAKGESLHEEYLGELPQGLMNYYHDHWRRMHVWKGAADWARLYKPVVIFLAVAFEPMTIQQLANFAEVSASEVELVIMAWRQFLDEVNTDGRRAWRIYHSTFQEFLARQVDFSEYRNRVADYYLAQWKGEARA